MHWARHCIRCWRAKPRWMSMPRLLNSAACIQVRNMIRASRLARRRLLKRRWGCIPPAVCDGVGYAASVRFLTLAFLKDTPRPTQIYTPFSTPAHAPTNEDVPPPAPSSRLLDAAKNPRHVKTLDAISTFLAGMGGEVPSSASGMLSHSSRLAPLPPVQDLAPADPRSTTEYPTGSFYDDEGKSGDLPTTAEPAFRRPRSCCPPSQNFRFRSCAAFSACRLRWERP